MMPLRVGRLRHLYSSCSLIAYLVMPRPKLRSISSQAPQGRVAPYPILTCPVCALMGRIPTPAEYLEQVQAVNAKAADVYRYMNFDQIKEFSEVADTVTV